MEKCSDLYPGFCLKKCSYGIHNDRISSLPVEVLLIILSLLPLKEMVKTSILSRRWLKLWVNTPVLDFRLGTTGFNNRLPCNIVNWVNHVLRQHKGRYLKEFRICFNLMNCLREHYDCWLAFAIARKVEILVLLSSDGVNEDYAYIFPDSLFFSSRKAIMDGGKSRVLHFNLKFLKSLSLKCVNINNETFHFLLRNCPFLERLELVRNQIMGDIVISDPTLVLKHLKIKRCRGLKVLIISNFNLVSLITWATSMEAIILQDLPMLVELSLRGCVPDFRSILSQSATCLRQLKSLDISVLVLKDFPNMLSILAQMTKLNRLVIRYVASHDKSLIVLLNVINSCKNLEEFVLKLTWASPKRANRARQEVERLTCERLKLFEFKGYYNRFSDYELLLYVVENAPALEKIILHPSNVICRSWNRPEDSTEQEAREITTMQIKSLRKTKRIPQHIDVVIVETMRTAPSRKLGGLC